jgi:hypothetical protein
VKVNTPWHCISTPSYASQYGAQLITGHFHVYLIDLMGCKLSDYRYNTGIRMVMIFVAMEMFGDTENSESSIITHGHEPK